MAPEVQNGVDLLQRMYDAVNTLDTLQVTPGVDSGLIQAAQEDV
jgi:hypothetical protein